MLNVMPCVILISRLEDIRLLYTLTLCLVELRVSTIPLISLCGREAGGAPAPRAAAAPLRFI